MPRLDRRRVLAGAGLLATQWACHPAAEPEPAPETEPEPDRPPPARGPDAGRDQASPTPDLGSDTSPDLAATADADVDAPSMATSAGVIDTHTHFWDTTRPGTPYPSTPNDKKLPPDLVRVGRPVGLTGTVVIEASGRAVDNDWVLSLAEGHDVVVGFSGGLPFGRPEFAGLLDRYAKNRFFRGIRVSGGDNWAAAATDFARLAERELQVDAHVQVGSLGAVAAVAKRWPRLRIVIDHFAYLNFDGDASSARFKGYRQAIRPFVDLPNVYAKISYLVEGTGRRGSAPADYRFYAPLLDLTWDTFGEDRVVFGSNWPVCLPFASYDVVVNIARRYAAARGGETADKLFWQNARAAYGFVPR